MQANFRESIRTREETPMNDMQIEKSAMIDKKVWTQPVIAVIEMNAARNKYPQSTKADSAYSKS